MYLRKGNLRFTITQDNKNKSLLIDEFEQSIDKRAGGDFFGYTNIYLQEKDVRSILPEEIVEIIDDNIEYEDEGNDFKSVVEKIIKFKILNNEKKIFDMNAHVERSLFSGQNQTFELFLEKKIHLKEKIKSILSGISEVQRVEHPKAGVMNMQAYQEVLDEVFDFLYENKLSAMMLVLSIDGYPSLRRRVGRKKSDELLKNIAYTLNTTFRTRDIIAYLGLGHFAVTLIKTYPDEIIYPLKRLEKNFRRAGVINSKISINARYKLIDLEMTVQDVIEKTKAKDLDYLMKLD